MSQLCTNIIVYPVDILGKFIYNNKFSQGINYNLLVIEVKLKGNKNQYKVLDEMILTGQFIRNSCLRYWIDNKDIKRNDLQKLCSQLASYSNFPWVKKLNSQARQASADRAWQSIQRFYKNFRLNKPGKKAVRPRDDDSSLAVGTRR